MDQDNQGIAQLLAERREHTKNVMFMLDVLFAAPNIIAAIERDQTALIARHPDTKVVFVSRDPLAAFAQR